MNDKYEAVVGLEVHAQLLTESKAFSGDSAELRRFPEYKYFTCKFGASGNFAHSK